MAITHPRRFTRGHQLDSFDPGVWKEFKGRLPSESSLIKDDDPKYRTTGNVALYMDPQTPTLYTHKNMCPSKCRTSHYNHYKGTHVWKCLTIMNIDFQPLTCDICYVPFLNHEGIITRHKCVWQTKNFHLKCAKDCGIITEKVYSHSVKFLLDVSLLKIKQMQQKDPNIRYTITKKTGPTGQTFIEVTKIKKKVLVS